MRAVHLLKTVGLSEYEAKTYLALLAGGEPMNGYEVAKFSGVPRGTIYEVLAKLVARGAAVSTRGVGRSQESFVALPVDTFIDRYRSKLTETLDGLADELPKVATESRAHMVLTLNGRDAVVAQMKEVVGRSVSQVWLSMWPDVEDDLREIAQSKVEDGVEVASSIFGPVENFPGRAIRHEYFTPAATERLHGHRMYLAVADLSEAVIAATAGDVWRGIWTDDLSVTYLAAEHVRYDIGVQILCRHIDFEAGGASLLEDPTLQFLWKSLSPRLSELVEFRPRPESPIVEQ